MQTSDQKQTCENCRFISFTRSSQNGVRDISCENPELQQSHLVDRDVLTNRFFSPPRLAFSCNRWAMRKPDLGFTPTHIRDQDDERLAVHGRFPDQGQP